MCSFGYHTKKKLFIAIEMSFVVKRTNKELPGEQVGEPRLFEAPPAAYIKVGAVNK